MCPLSAQTQTYFQGLLHAPTSTPEMVEYGFAISPGTENFMSVRAEVLFSDEDIKDISYKIRQCWMQDEKYLRYFKPYAYLNCQMECASNHTLEVSVSVSVVDGNFVRQRQRGPFSRPNFRA